MNTKKVIISLQGRSCTGKSTVADLIKEKYIGIYTVDYDKVKRQLSGYDRYNDALDMMGLSFAFFESVCRLGKPILLLVPPFHDEVQYLQYKTVADSFGYTFFNFEFIASREVLLKRYRERLESITKAGNKVLIKTEDEYLKTLETPYYVPQDSVRFDTSDDNAEMIAGQILEKVHVL